MDDCLRRLSRVRGTGAGLLAAAMLLAGTPAYGQHRLFQRWRTDPCPPPPVCPPVAPPAPVEPGKKPEAPKTEAPPKEERPTPPAAEAAPFRFEGGPAVRGATVAYATPNMQGDQLGIPAIAFGPRGSPTFPPQPGQIPGAVVVPSVRSFKIAENDSPFPRDRVYFGYHYYDDVNKAVNQRFGSDLQNLRVHRGMFGLEKTFLDGNASVGLRLPLDTLNTDSRVPGFGGDSTSTGDLSVVFKAALLGDLEAGRVLTAGLAVTAPTGPDRFAGFDSISPTIHTTVLQPFTGAVLTSGDFFIQGFSAVDVPTDSRDVTMWYNDIGMGYFLYRDAMGSNCITAIVPTLEVHVNTPLNHRGILRGTDPSGTPDVVALTSGVTFELHNRATLAFGLVTPLTGPRPFDWEVLAQLNIRFGASRGRAGIVGF